MEETRKMSEDIPYVVSEGVLKLGELEIKVAVLNTGQKVIYQEDMTKFLNWLDDPNVFCVKEYRDEPKTD